MKLCVDCIHIAVCYRRVGMTSDSYAEKCGDYQPSRKGHWIEVAKYSDGKHKIECSECGNYIFDRGHANSQNVKEKYKYCNYCGASMADMRGRVKNEFYI